MNRDLKDIAGPEAFRCLVENAALPIAIADIRGRFVYVNEALADALGFRPEEVMAEPSWNFCIRRISLGLCAFS